MADNPRSALPDPLDAQDQLESALADPDGIDELEASLDPEGDHQGIGHRADKSPSDREHGRKTRQRSKDIINGRA